MELIREEAYENEGTRKIMKRFRGPIKKKDIAMAERHDAIESIYNK